jgi:hypothetical protein
MHFEGRRLEGRLERVAELGRTERDAMFTLMDRHYENVNRDTFAADLAEKSWVILLSDPESGALCGFSTQVMLEVAGPDRPLRALFSGDTIVDRARWGDSALAHVWGRLALSLIDRYEGAELYWFLISKGYKTYRFLPLFFHEFYPRHDRPTPSWARGALDALGRRKFAAAYDPASGIIRADARKDRLRPGVAELTRERLRDPHIRFFAERNPGHVRGDELCCLAPLTRANFTSAAYRVIGPAPALVEAVR